MSKKGKDSVQPTQVVSWKKMLEARPVRNVAADFQSSEEGEVSIQVSKRKPVFLIPPFSWFIRPNLKHTVRLDKIGTQIWKLCDGQRTVEDVIDEFSKIYKLSFHEARVSVTGYIKLLIQRGVIAIITANPRRP